MIYAGTTAIWLQQGLPSKSQRLKTAIPSLQCQLGEAASPWILSRSPFLVVAFVKLISLPMSFTPALIHVEPMTVPTWRFSCVVTASMVADRGDREFNLSLVLLRLWS